VLHMLPSGQRRGLIPVVHPVRTHLPAAQLALQPFDNVGQGEAALHARSHTPSGQSLHVASQVNALSGLALGSHCSLKPFPLSTLPSPHALTQFNVGAVAGQVPSFLHVIETSPPL
jgi:hypothetical protein